MTTAEPSTLVPDLPIGEVARHTGQTIATLRHWEAMGLIPPPPRVGGKRRYPAEVLSRVAMIDLVQRAGFSLEEARELLDSRSPGRRPGPEWRALTARKRAELDELLSAIQAAQRLLAHLGDCHCRSLDECLAQVAERC